MDFENYLDYLKKDNYEDYKNKIDFNDEIIDIEFVGEEEMGDIEVSGSHLFIMNDILVHNSAINNTMTVDNSFISDSLGTAMTADWMCFLLQNELMKAQGLLNFKITKNRYNGLTSEFTMNVDYQKMRVEEEHTFNNIQEKKNIENQTNELLELSNLNDLKNMNIQSLNNLEWN